MDHTTNVSNAVVATTITIWGIATGLSYEVLLAGVLLFQLLLRPFA